MNNSQNPLVAPQDLVKLVDDLRSGKTSVVSYVSSTLDRVEKLEKEVLSLLPETGRRERLLKEAQVLEEKYKDAKIKPALYGILLGVKDLFAAKGFETRAGSRLDPSLFEMNEGPVVSALKDAGALILGKTVTTEFAYFSPGPTKNPWNTTHTPGGSSSGSAAALAAGFCALSIGTQTIGSISRPAAFCGVAGFKPSYERTSRVGAVAFSPALDHVGLFASNVEGLAVSVPVIMPSYRKTVFETARTRFHSLRNLPVLAVPEGSYLAQADSEALTLFNKQIAYLEQKGFTIKRIQMFSDIEEINARHRRIAAADLYRVHKEWFVSNIDLYSDTTRELIEKGSHITDTELEEDKRGRLSLRLQIDAVLEAAHAEYFICPSALGGAPEGLSATGSPIMNLPWTHAGVPSLSIPAHFTGHGLTQNGLPLGLQLVAPFGDDEELLALGMEVEKS